MLAHDGVDHRVMLLAFSRLFYVLLDVLNDLAAHCCLVVGRDVGLVRVDYLFVRHVGEQLVFVEVLEVGNQLAGEVVLAFAHLSV